MREKRAKESIQTKLDKDEESDYCTKTKKINNKVKDFKLNYIYESKLEK